MEVTRENAKSCGPCTLPLRQTVLFFLRVHLVSCPQALALLTLFRHSALYCHVDTWGSVRCACGLMCPRTQPDVPTYSARCAHRPMCPRTQPMCPRTQPDVLTDRCVHVFRRTPVCPRTHSGMPTDRCAHVLSPMCPRTDHCQD